MTRKWVEPLQVDEAREFQGSAKPDNINNKHNLIIRRVGKVYYVFKGQTVVDKFNNVDSAREFIHNYKGDD